VLEQITHEKKGFASWRKGGVLEYLQEETSGKKWGAGVEKLFDSFFPLLFEGVNVPVPEGGC